MAQDPLNLLCVEPSFPGRLGWVADWLVRKRGYRCHFFCHSAGPKESWPGTAGRGMDVVSFGVGGVAREAAVTWHRSLERSLCYSFGAWEVISHRRPGPIDAVLGRSDGLGSSLFMPVFVPRTPVVQLFDYYYHGRKRDLADEAGPEFGEAYPHWRRAVNAIDLLDLENGVVPWVPTEWQRDLYPPEYRADFMVLHDGIDARTFASRPGRHRMIAGRTIDEGTKIITFVARNLDKLRGFDRFMGLANRLIRERTDLIAVVVGDPRVTRSLDVAFHGKDYREHVLKLDPPSDPGRIWFLGTVAPNVVADVLVSSDLHVYPSRTYPASRSLLQAMAAGRVVLATDDAPVREVLRPGVDGLLADPADPDDWVRLGKQVLDDPAGHAALGASASARVREEYDRDVTLPRLAGRLNQLAGLGG